MPLRPTKKRRLVCLRAAADRADTRGLRVQPADRAYGPFDAAFLPINGARQRDGRFIDQGIPAVLTPSQAVAAAHLLRAKLIVPIHFGNPDPPDYVEVPDPLGELRREASKVKMPIRVMAAGESFHVKGNSDMSLG
jgi:L-ascorbate metabolism protein UlaG (beta-lactamase superfamily)